jgi:hypothetical protein
VISGPVANQAALHGLLAQIGDLGLELVSLQRAEASGSEASQKATPAQCR